MSQTLLGVVLGLVALAVLLAVFPLRGRGLRLRDAACAGVAALVAVVAGVLAWYAWAESHSVAWTGAYSFLCASAVAGSVRFGLKAAGRSAA